MVTVKTITATLLSPGLLKTHKNVFFLFFNRNKSKLDSLSAATAKLKRAAKIMRTNQQTV
jgi:hypothetical protein